MAQHFLLSKAAETFSLAKVFQMKDEEAEATFCLIRWADNDGKPVCPHCGGLDAYDCRRLKGAPRFRCRACGKDFSITSGTLFASHKLPLRGYLAAIAIFCNEVKGKSALAISRDLCVSYKCAFVLLHKLREAMAAELKGRVIGGEGKVAEVDGGYFGGYVKPANHRENRRDRRLACNQNGKRRVVVIVRERNGNGVPAVFKTEAQAVSFISHRVANGTTINADEAASWDGLHGRFEMKRINHEEAYPGRCLHELGGGIFRRLRRAEIGHHHHVAGLLSSPLRTRGTWREDNRRDATAIRCSDLRRSRQSTSLRLISADIGSVTRAKVRGAH